jgi:serine/threonine protein phosphatase PrpC
MLQAESTGYTHIGRRENNEDSHCVDVDLGLYAVADGMGGHEGGEVASRVAICTITDVIQSNGLSSDTTWPATAFNSRTSLENMVDLAIRTAHQQVVKLRTGRLRRMGSTLSALLLRDGRAIVGHVGDSRVYRLRGEQFIQMTRDHSLYEEMLAKGVPNLGPREEFPYGNIITQALGTRTGAVPDILSDHVVSGDIYLLCTDGLTGALPDSLMSLILQSLPLDEACERLVKEAYSRGSQDNITAVLVRVL